MIAGNLKMSKNNFVYDCNCLISDTCEPLNNNPEIIASYGYRIIIIIIIIILYCIWYLIREITET